MVNKSNTFRAKGNGRIAFNIYYSIYTHFWSILKLLRPKEFDSEPTASAENDPDSTGDSDSSSGNDNDLFVNTNRPQCTYESSDTSNESEYDSSKHEGGE